MILQLNPTVPIETPKGSGQALLVIDPGTEHHLLWTVAIDETGEIWTFPNPEVRTQKNVTMGRLLNKVMDKMNFVPNTNENNITVCTHKDLGKI